MRVLISCLQSLRRHEIPAYGFWREYFIEGCREAGIEPLEVPEVDWAEALTYQTGSAELESWRGRTWERTLAFAREQQAGGGIDFFLGYLYPQQVEEAAVRELQRMDIPCVNFFCDNVREFRRVPEAYRPFDLHWVPEHEALPMYRRAGLQYIHTAMPCWVPERLRTSPSHETEPASFIGSADILRRKLIGQAMLAGADFVVRGPGWRQSSSPDEALVPEGRRRSVLINQMTLVGQHGCGALTAKLVNAAMPLKCPGIPAARIADPVFGDEYFRVTREAAVTIGVNRVPVARRPLCMPLSYSRLRDIEAPMLGACYLTEHTSGIEHLYDTGKEIETYRSAAELADKLEQLIQDAAKRKRLRLAGQRRALCEHTVAASLGKICSHLGISQKNKSSL
jgi:hypothetical protein